MSEIDVLSVVEPYVYEDMDDGQPTIPEHRAWHLFTPSVRQVGEARYAFRAALWVSRRHRAQAVPIPTHDLAAATITTLDRKILIVAAYDVRLGGSDVADNEQLISPP
jgi:hypothetical protein